MSFDDRWLPYLGDAVTLHLSGQSANGRVSRFDPALVEVDLPMHVAIGDLVAATWQVGAEQHEASASVEEIVGGGFTVRLPQARVSTESRRGHERVNLSVRMQLSQPSGGSLERARSGRTLDLSNTGARALIDDDQPLSVGQTLEVRLELGDSVEILTAQVVWERGHGRGERLAGLRFDNEVVATRWAALAAVKG
jgi:hypothetical protein